MNHHTRFALATDVLDCARQIEAATGRRHVPFCDEPFCRTVGRDVDLFQLCSSRSGQSVELREAVVKVGPGFMTAIYFIPVEHVDRFLQFLSTSAFMLSDGSLGRACHAAPGSTMLTRCLATCPVPEFAKVVADCHLIAGVRLSPESDDGREWMARAIGRASWHRRSRSRR